MEQGYTTKAEFVTDVRTCRSLIRRVEALMLARTRSSEANMVWDDVETLCRDLEAMASAMACNARNNIQEED